MELALAVYEEITGTTPLPAVEGEDSDRRKHRRMPFGFRATILPTRRGVEGPATVVMIRDMSLAGISILNEDALKNGTNFTIEFKGQRERPVKIRCTAVRCEQGGTGGTQYVIGATFDELLTKELPPLPKEEPLPPLSDQSHIRGRLIKPDSEIAHHTGVADGFSDNSGPAPAQPFSVTSQPEPDQPAPELTRIYGRLIRPNSEFEKAAVSRQRHSRVERPGTDFRQGRHARPTAGKNARADICSRPSRACVSRSRDSHRNRFNKVRGCGRRSRGAGDAAGRTRRFPRWLHPRRHRRKLKR